MTTGRINQVTTIREIVSQTLYTHQEKRAAHKFMHSLPDLSWFNRVFVLKLLSVDDVFLVPQTNLGLG